MSENARRLGGDLRWRRERSSDCSPFTRKGIAAARRAGRRHGAATDKGGPERAPPRQGPAGRSGAFNPQALRSPGKGALDRSRGAREHQEASAHRLRMDLRRSGKDGREEGIPPGTAWEDAPEDFEMIEIADLTASSRGTRHGSLRGRQRLVGLCHSAPQPAWIRLMRRGAAQSRAGRPSRPPLHVQIAIALTLLLGFAASQAAEDLGGLVDVLDFVGGLFLSALRMVVVPPVLSSIVVGVANMASKESFGRVGAKTVALYLLTGLIAVATDLRCHDHPNLYVLGSAVFPTSATANPTLTIAALAVRLAARLREELRG